VTDAAQTLSDADPEFPQRTILLLELRIGIGNRTSADSPLQVLAADCFRLSVQLRECSGAPQCSKPSFLAYSGTFGQLIGVLLQDTGTQVSPEGLGSSHRLRRLPSTIWVSTPLHVSTVSHCLLLRCFPHVELLCAREQAQATVMA
jgi:hypothetical protein